MVTQLLNCTSGHQISACSIFNRRIVQTAAPPVGACHFNRFCNHTSYLCNTAANHSPRVWKEVDQLLYSFRSIRLIWVQDTCFTRLWWV